jgi:hypothetical protein
MSNVSQFHATESWVILMTNITLKDIANAAMGHAAVKQIAVTRMPPTRPEMCPGCPFGRDVDGITALKCEVLKDELRARPNAVWMCHETADGGARPTEKSIICKGFNDWRAKTKITTHFLVKQGTSLLVIGRIIGNEDTGYRFHPHTSAHKASRRQWPTPQSCVPSWTRRYAPMSIIDHAPPGWKTKESPNA